MINDTNPTDLALSAILDRAKTKPKRIVFAEGDDPRIQEAAGKAAAAGVAVPTLLVSKKVDDLGDGVRAIDVNDPEHVENLRSLASTKTKEHVNDPLYQAGIMLDGGLVDGAIAGAVATTSDTIRAAIRTVGSAPEIHRISSFFLMVCQPPFGTLTFADCALSIDPDPRELAEIATLAAANHKLFTGEEPRVAMLSFSTKGSASAPTTDKVIEATELVHASNPDLMIDGELQLDAALIEAVGSSKASGSPVAGQANVLVFPDLNSGNIGYKLAQRLGNATALGPILQGLKKPYNDLSRGCSADDAFYMAAITSICAA